MGLLDELTAKTQGPRMGGLLSQWSQGATPLRQEVPSPQRMKLAALLSGFTGLGPEPSGSVMTPGVSEAKQAYNNAEMAGLLSNLVPAKAIAATLGAPLAAMGLLSKAAEMKGVSTAANIPAGLRNQAGAIVWHGSPHKFDKFDMSKIGTGEGAQAYGHGLYMAEAPAVAAEYKPAGLKGEEGTAAHYLKIYKTKEKAIEALQENIGPQMTSASNAYTQRAIDILNSGEGNTGNLYKVDIPDEAVARFLDWDKPLSQQAPEVQKMLEPLGYSSKAQVAAHDDALMAALMGDGSTTLPKINDPMGSDIARGGGLFDGPDQVRKAQKLKELGIPGIRYLDGGSRSGGQGTSNYVLFSDQLPRILERNGVPTGQAPWQPGEWKGLLNP